MTGATPIETENLHVDSLPGLALVVNHLLYPFRDELDQAIYGVIVMGRDVPN